MTNERRPGAADARNAESQPGNRPANSPDTKPWPDPRPAAERREPLDAGVAHRRPRHVLIYDDSCAMCRSWAGRVRRWDRHHRIELVPSHGAYVGSRFPWIARERLDLAMQFVEPNGTTHEGAAAAEALLRVLPLGRLLAWPFAVPGVRMIAARVYRAIAARRCREACAVHSAERGMRP